MDSNFWYKLLQDIIVLSVSAIAPVVVGLIVVVIKKKLAEIKLLYPDYAPVLEAAAKFAIQAAEEAKFAGLIEDKKEYALGVAQKYLDDHKVKIQLDVISAAIEAGIYEGMNKDRIAEVK
jgi:hypothetical protein